MYTIDASVWINGFDQRELGYDYSRQLLESIRNKGVSIIIPNIVLAEVAGAISRTRKNPKQAIIFTEAMSKLPNVKLIPIDGQIARQASELAAQYALRGADAIYAAVAKQFNCVLISLDNEHLTRLKEFLNVQTPESALEHQ